MRKIISFMHMTLDGFVTGPKGELSWAKVDAELFDYVGKRISKTDTALYGRTTYQLMEGYWPGAGTKPNASKHDIEHSKWYNDVHKIVLSKSMNGASLNNTEIINENLVESINEIKSRPGSEILLFGSPTATRALIQQNLIDGFWIFLNPTILGKGTALFADINDKIKLNLQDTKRFTNGVIELNYVVDRS